MRKLWFLSIVMCLSLAVSSASGMSRQKERLRHGHGFHRCLIPGAKVTVTGQTVNAKKQLTNGTFKVDNLIPGTYAVKVEQTGFKTAVANNVTVNVGKESSLNLKLETGEITATVDVTATAGGIDQQSTASGQNLNDQLFQNVPVQRGVSSLFYLSPGATDSINGGRDNPSIAGGSALDNLYVADGVNITEPAFGGVGTFSRSYGTGNSINTRSSKKSRSKLVALSRSTVSPKAALSTSSRSQVATLSRAVYGFPPAFESNRLQPMTLGTTRYLFHEENYDVGADVGGYVPGLQNRLFFFGSFNPTIRREIVQGVSANASDIAAGNGDAVNSGLFTQRGQFARRYRTYNYAGKLDWILNPNHQITFSIFGDPTKTNLSSFSALNIDNTTGDSVLDYGTRNWAVRYNGSLSPTWTLNSSFSQGRSKFDETGFANLNLIQVREPIDPVRGNYVAEGRGFFEPTTSSNWKWDVNTAKIWNRWGQHQVGVGYTYQRSLLATENERPRYTIP